MSTAVSAPVATLHELAHAAGLTLTAVEPGTDFAGAPTDRYIAALTSDPSKNQALELSQAFEQRVAGEAALTASIRAYLQEAATRLLSPRSDVHLTLLGLPLSFGKFAWPFHGSTSGADTSIVHGEVRLEDGGESVLHAKISASMTRTFAEVVPALEQPFAEGFIYNAVRKTVDQGQIELVKSGNGQPVPVTTRYYSVKRQIFIFNDTTDQQRRDFLAGKVFWLSAMLGANMPVWIADPRDAQYLNTTPAELKSAAAQLAGEGLVELSEFGAAGEWAGATDKLRNDEPKYRNEIAEALNFIKPSFNESMRAGETNM